MKGRIGLFNGKPRAAWKRNVASRTGKGCS